MVDVYGAETVQHLDDHALGEVRLEIDGLVYGTGKKAFLWVAIFFSLLHLVHALRYIELYIHIYIFGTYYGRLF